MTLVFPPDMRGESPVWDLALGFLFFCIALYGALNGKVWTRYSWVKRIKQPKTFWVDLVLWLVLSLFLIGRSLYLISGP